VNGGDYQGENGNNHGNDNSSQLRAYCMAYKLPQDQGATLKKQVEQFPTVIGFLKNS
jgi:hypothetical protein